MSPLSSDSFRWDDGSGAQNDIAAVAASGFGREAPLILIEEHLTDEKCHFPSTPGFRTGNSALGLMENWFFPEEWSGPPPDGYAQVLKIQAFKNGGYEASLRGLNVKRIGSAIEFGGCRGKREKPEYQSRESVLKSGQRAKRMVRLSVKNMAATNLLTLSKREGPNTKDWSASQWAMWETGGGREAWCVEHGDFWDEDRWAQAFDLFRRNCARAMGGNFPYVGVLEPHRKGNFHLHLAWCGKVNLNLVRPVWWASCGGRGQGNIQAEYIKVRSGLDRSSRIASYISKYVSKSFENSGRFNKKRYWASRQTLPEIKRFVLRSHDLTSAMAEVKTMLGLDWGLFNRFENGSLIPDHIFLFPDGGGLWFNYIPELHATPPPF